MSKRGGRGEFTAGSWIWGYFKRYKWAYAVTIFIGSTGFVAMALWAPKIYGSIAGEVFEEGNTDKLLPLLAMIVGVTIVKSIFTYCSRVSYEHMSQGMVFDLRQDIYRRLQNQSFRFFDDNRVGDVMSRMTGDLDAVRHFYAYVVYAVYENILFFVVALVLMFQISWPFTLGCLAVAPFIGYFAMKQTKSVKPMFAKIREQFSRLNSVCQENISGNRVVKAFTREDYEIEKFNAENQAYYDANVDSVSVWIKYLPTQDFLAGLLSFVAIVGGGVLAVNGHMTIAGLVTINGYLWCVSNPMRQMGWLINDVQRYTTSLDKIFGMISVKVAVKTPESAEEVKKEDRGAVEFENVSFSYDKFNLPNVLKNISFKALPGYTVGIVGPTGSGKTTLVSLIARFYDATEGIVKVGGRDVKERDLLKLRDDIALAMQDVFLFSDTIEGNLAYGEPNAPMEDLIKAAKVADAAGFVTEMPEGYDTIIGERGVGLSGGQRQRISLARAIAANPAILVLDDTTSAVDMETEHEIQKALDEGYADRTKFIIAHRISSVRKADLILVLVDGAVIERGTHDELLEQKGYYYELFTEQYPEAEGNENGEK